MRYLLFFCTLFMLTPQIAFAEAKRLAILEFRGIGVEDEGLLLSLGDGVLSGLIKNVDTTRYQVMTRENTLQILKDMGKDASCMAGECEVEVARNIGADFVISGTLTLISNTYLVTLKLHNTHTAALLASDQVENKNGLALVKQMAKLGQQLMQEGGISNQSKNPKVNPASYFKGGFSKGESAGWMMEPAKEKGVLSFSSTPKGAVVMLNGKLLCQATPCSKSIDLGNHQVSIQKERYFPWEQTISALSSRTVRSLSAARSSE